MVSQMSSLAIAIVLLLAGQGMVVADDESIETRFACDGGLTLAVTFDNSRNVAIVTPEGGEPVTLPIAVSGSGYLYEGEGASLRGKGDEATWTAAGAAPTECKAQD